MPNAAPRYNIYDDPDLMRQAVDLGQHREVIGGMWDELGALQAAFLIAQGLSPRHVLIDIGAGSFRAGMKLVPYLDAGNYYAIDLQASLLWAGYTREILPAGLAGRSRPQVRCRHRAIGVLAFADRAAGRLPRRERTLFPGRRPPVRHGFPGARRCRGPAVPADAWRLCHLAHERPVPHHAQGARPHCLTSRQLAYGGYRELGPSAQSADGVLHPAALTARAASGRGFFGLGVFPDLLRPGIDALGIRIAVDQLDDRHRRVVAVAEPRLENAGIAAGALGVALGQRGQHLVSDLGVLKVGDQAAARREAAALAGGDEALDDGTQILRLGQRRGDLLMLQQSMGEIVEHRLAMGRSAAEMPAIHAVTHNELPRRRLLGLVRFLEALRQLLDILRRPVRNLHTEMEAHLRQHFLDLVERLATEIRRPQHLGLGLLNQVADIDDVVVLETVGRAHRQFKLVDLAQQVLVERQFARTLLGADRARLVEIDEELQLVLE